MANAMDEGKCPKYLLHPDYQRQLVYKGLMAKTSGGLTSDKLTENRHGKIVSMARHSKGLQHAAKHPDMIFGRAAAKPAAKPAAKRAAAKKPAAKKPAAKRATKRAAPEESQSGAGYYGGGYYGGAYDYGW